MGKLVRSRGDGDGGSGLTASIEDRAARWLDALLLHTGGIEPPVDVVVSHAAVDQSRRVIRSYRVDALPIAHPDLYTLAEEIAEAITLDAEDLGGVQRYQLVARCHGQEVGSTTVRYAMELLPSAVDSEPANSRGLVAQAQRHTEAAVRMMMQGQGTVVASLQKRLAEQDAFIERMTARWLDFMEQKEALLVERAEIRSAAEERKLEREVAAAKEIAEIERKATTWKELVAMVKFTAPLLMQRYLESDAGRTTATPMHAALEADYLKNVTDEQLETIKARFPPELFAEFEEQVRKARHSGSGASATATAAADASSGSSPPGEARSPSAATVKPLEGDAKLGAAKLLAAKLLPVVTSRHVAGQPLIDLGTDDLTLFALFRRLVASTSRLEMEMILGSLPENERAATVALAEAMNLPLPDEGGHEGTGGSR